MDCDFDFIYVTTAELANQQIEVLKASDSHFACDTEACVRPEYEKTGSALDPHTSMVSLLIVKTRQSKPIIFDVIWLKHANYDFTGLLKVLDEHTTVWAGYKYDANELRVTFNGWTPAKPRCVIVMARLISNASGSKAARAHGHSYADLCREYLSVHISGKGDGGEQVTSWGIGLSARTIENKWWIDKLDYAASDTKHLLPLYDSMYSSLTRTLPHTDITQTGNYDIEWGFGMEEVLERETLFMDVVADIEYIGFPVSVEIIRDFQDSVSEMVEQLAVELSIELGLDTPIPNWEGKLGPTTRALKKLRSSSGLLDLVQEALKIKKLDNVQAKVLSRMLDVIDRLSKQQEEGQEDPDSIFISEDEAELFSELVGLENSELVAKSPLVKKILQFKKYVKQESMDLSKFVHKETGRIHSKLNQNDASTGRCIAKGMKILVPGGEKNIEEIVVGDHVYCYDQNSSPTIRKVLNTWYRGEKEVVKVKWQSSGKNNHTGSLICTPCHLVLSKKNGWTKASDLCRYEKVFHLQRKMSLQRGRNRPRLYGTNCFAENEQITIKREYFCADSSMHIHHINFVSDGNRLGNLEVLTAKEHLSLHSKKLWSEGKISIEPMIKAKKNRTRKLKDLCKRFNVEYTNHSVTSVRPAGIMPVYDIEVEDFNNFICQEICVHNCSSASPNMQQVSGRVKAVIRMDKQSLFRGTSKLIGLKQHDA